MAEASCEGVNAALCVLGNCETVLYCAGSLYLYGSLKTAAELDSTGNGCNFGGLGADLYFFYVQACHFDGGAEAEAEFFQLAVANRNDLAQFEGAVVFFAGLY